MRRLPWLLPVVSFQRGNPDHIESSSASHYGEYDITGVTDLTEETYETAHGGYDPVYANEDPDRVLPVDVLRDMEKRRCDRIASSSVLYNCRKWNICSIRKKHLRQSIRRN